MITIFVPAKGHSERVISKNLREIEGKSLIQRALDFAQKLDRVSAIILSTDSDQFVTSTFSDETIGQAFASVPTDAVIPAGGKLYIHKRPQQFSSTHSTTTSLLMHYLSIQTRTDSHLLLLQPTSPFRLESDKDYINSIDLESVDSLFSVSRVESPHPAKTFQRKSNGEPILSAKQIEQLQTPAQTLGVYFAPDGAFYLIRISEFLETKSLISKASICFERTGHRTINIDTEGDLDFARYIAEKEPDKI
jgi:CMP-N-acetylneuraminic acid synthetase